MPLMIENILNLRKIDYTVFEDVVQYPNSPDKNVPLKLYGDTLVCDLVTKLPTKTNYKLSLNVNTIRKIHLECKKLNSEIKRVNTVLIFYSTSKSNAVVEYIKTKMESADIKVQTLESRLLLFDIMGHELQPKFFKIENSSEIPAYTPEKEILCKILTTDPVVEIHGWQIGDILRICPNNNCCGIPSGNFNNTKFLCCEECSFRQVSK